MHTRKNALAITLAVFATLSGTGLPASAENRLATVTAGIAATQSADVSAQMLDRIVYPIVTVVEHANGARGVNTGSGFVVGQRFYTVQHNIRVGPSERRTITIDGVAVSPAYSDRKHDLAVFILPDELCARICNQVSFAPMPALESTRPVFWLRKFQGEHVYKHGAVLSYALLGDSGGRTFHEWSCDDHLVVEINAPFTAGTSGSPVVHVGTGRIVGIVQGTFESGGVRTGYFMPMNCVRQLTGALTDSIS